MPATVAVLPVRTSVQSAWDRYTELCARKAVDPTLADDADFEAKLAAAYDAYRAVYERWDGR